MAFSSDEASFIQTQSLARLATTSTDGQPDVVLVAFEFDGTHFWVGGPGESVLNTRKFRNLRAGNH